MEIMAVVLHYSSWAFPSQQSRAVKEAGQISAIAQAAIHGFSLVNFNLFT